MIIEDLQSEINRLQSEIASLFDLIRRHKHEGIETEKLYLQGIIAPAFRPLQIGMVYIDTAAGKVYVSTGTTTSGDWQILN